MSRDFEVGSRPSVPYGANFFDIQCIFKVTQGVDAVGLLGRDKRRLDISSVNKEAKQSAREIPGVEEGNGEEDLRCKSLFTLCQRRLWFSDDDETRLE